MRGCDALVLTGSEGEQVYTLEGADRAYRVLIEAMNDGAVTMASDGTILYCNRHFADMMKSPLEKVIGSTIYRFISQSDKAAFRALKQKLERGELALQAEDESTVPVYISINSLQLSESQEAFCVVVTDLTEQKQKEEIVAAEKLARSIIEQATEAVVVCDQKGKIIRFSNAVSGILGSDQSLQSFEDLFDMRTPVGEKLSPVSSALGGDVLLQVEAGFERRDGRMFHLLLNAGPLKNADGKIIGCVVTLTDITERKQIEEELRNSERLYRAIGESIDYGVWVCAPDGRNIYASESFLKLVGITQEQCSNFGWGDVLHPDDSERTIAAWKECVRTGDTWDIEHRFRGVDGMWHPILARGVPVRNEQGQIICWAGINLDISQLKQAEEKLLRAKDELEQRVQERTAELQDAKENLEVINEELHVEIDEHEKTEKELLRAKEEAEEAVKAKPLFLANMSHELRTPMNAVIGFTGLLLDEPLAPEHKDYLESIRNSGNALLALINDLLDFSRMERENVEIEEQPFDLRTIVEESLDQVAGDASKKNLDLAYSIDKDMPEAITGDPARLRQVLVNLLGNAVKYTDEGEAVLSVLPKGQDEILFKIRDTGIGIPEEKKNILFQPFSRVDESFSSRYEGAGLGLAISKKLIEVMGGRIWVESAPGQGSTFYFTIKAKAVPGKPKAIPTGIQPKLEGKNVLIVDDNKTNRIILGKQLNSWGMIPVAKPSGREALALIRSGAPFDVAILDMLMPEMDGVALAKEIRKYRKDLPLILLSSVGQKGVPGLFEAVLNKPIKPANLYQVLSDTLAARQSIEEAESLGLEANRNPMRILLAEDNVSNQKVTLQMLKKLGYRADAVANGAEALQALERQHYDLILMDIKMPVLGGIEATKMIRERWPNNGPKIIAITAYALHGDKEKCLDAGMDGYISKPVQKEDLARALKDIDRL